MHSCMRKLLSKIVFTIAAAVSFTIPSHAQEQSWEVLNRQVSELHKNGQFSEAATVAKQSLKVAERIFGPDHLNVAKSLNILSGLYFGLSKNTEAEPLMKRALSIQEKALAENYQAVLSSIKGLGAIYLRQDRLNEAEPLMKRALALSEQSQGHDHPETAKHVGNLGGLYLKQDKFEEAERRFNRALNIWKKEGPNVHYTVPVMTNLAGLYAAQGKYPKAKRLYQRALKIAEEALVTDHPQIAQVLQQYSGFLHKTGQTKEARLMKERATRMRADGD